MAAWRGDVRRAPRARRPRERISGRGCGCRRRHGSAFWPRAPSSASARGTSAHRTPSLEPRRGRPLLRPKRRHDVLLASLRWSWISTGLSLRFVSFQPINSSVVCPLVERSRSSVRWSLHAADPKRPNAKKARRRWTLTRPCRSSEGKAAECDATDACSIRGKKLLSPGR